MPVSPLRSALLGALAATALGLAVAGPAFAGDPATSLKVNEAESEGRYDFVELVNRSDTTTTATGLVLKDDDDSHAITLPDTTIGPGRHLAVRTDGDGGFDLGASDSARLFLADGTTLVDGFSWTTHAATTYGRCPDGTGGVVQTDVATPDLANACPAAPALQTWPGSQSVFTADEAGALGGDVSGLDYEGSGSAKPGVLWAVDNGNRLLRRLVWDGARWVDDATNDWPGGKLLRTPSGGLPDAEGVTLTDAGAAGGVYVSSESDSAFRGISRPAVLRYDVSAPGDSLSAVREWNLTADLPPVGSNAGAESVEWVPDSALVGSGFVDERTGEPYRPSQYPGHGNGLFFVGIEANGNVYAYALDQDSSTSTRIATFQSGFKTFGALDWERETNRLWVVCDDNCDGRSRLFEISTAEGPRKGRFVAVADYARPTGLANLNDEGFTTTPGSECVGGRKPVFWADDANTDSHALRAGTIPCVPGDATAGWSTTGSARGDFDGDGFADLAVGVPGEADGSGAVQVLYGSAAGIGTAGTQTFTQNTPGIAGTAETGDAFGAVLAAGDLDGDGRADLAIGAPGENTGAGAVHVLYGSSTGLAGGASMTSQYFSQNTSGIASSEESQDGFGSALAIGELGRGAKNDLAIGVPGEDSAAGIVQVVYADAARITGSGSQTLSQDSPGIGNVGEAGDRFGTALAAGQVAGSDTDDLLVGAPGEDLGAGTVHALPGSGTGLTATGSATITQGVSTVRDTAEGGDAFGASLAIGRSDTSYEVVAIGAPGEDSGNTDIGLVLTIRSGNLARPLVDAQQTWTQNTAGVAGSAGTGDRFGAALAFGDVTGDARGDLAVGVPGEESGAGAVHVLPGAGGGRLTATGSQLFQQGVDGVLDRREPGDRFGDGLTSGDYDGDGHADLVVGVPYEDDGSIVDAGRVNLLRGSAAGLTTAGQQFLGQASPGVPGNPGAAEHFGSGLGR